MSTVETVSSNGGSEEGLYPPILQHCEGALLIRTETLKKHFITSFDKEPLFYVRVPGRVNLIGEHVDYCGYSVCPMAIQQDILVAVQLADNETIHLTNVDSKYPDFTCSLSEISIDKNGPPEWHNYFLCGVKGVLDTLTKESKGVGMIAAITGNIPPNSGLSSSSALVSAAALSTSHANKLQFTKQEIASLAAKAERFVGTEGGGMDQAIAFLGTKGCAKHIEFNPLRSKDIYLPAGVVFVIAHSLAELNKAATSDFNCRVAECRLASQLIAKQCNLPWEDLTRLADLQKALVLDLSEMISLVMKTLHEEPYTKEEICRLLEVNDDRLAQTSLTNNTAHCQQFKLKQRALHVFQEASRVQRFCEECSRGDGGDENALYKLSDLMRKSHTSLQQLYECSHPNLDQVVQLGETEGFGSRLTGAGWGGCVVALTTQESAESYIKLLKDKFYRNHPTAQGRDLDLLVFATEPCAGAAVYQL